ncbi:MAG TPA: cytochrome c [Candidatus Binatia bacterium]|jgi:quinoprotein glucose dehydrogenase|nr:cytochrome c [Candidatus Binatia bacterium]
MSRQACFTVASVSAGIAWLASAALAVGAAGHERPQEAKTTTSRTVWDGVYTEEQAKRGRTQYIEACASCHAEDLRGQSTAPSLVEESFSFLWGDMTVGDLFDQIRKLMPSNRPNSLSSQSYRDIVAFILQSNKFPPGKEELDADLDALRQIRLGHGR